VSVVYLLIVEAMTLSDGIPSNHVTAVVRQAWQKEPWVFLWICSSLAYLAGHFFAAGKDAK
jgi:hypothetical protein